MNMLCVQFTPGFAGDELNTSLMLNRPCFELNLIHMAAITERKQCIFFTLSNSDAQTEQQLQTELPAVLFSSQWVFLIYLFYSSSLSQGCELF